MKNENSGSQQDNRMKGNFFSPNSLSVKRMLPRKKKKRQKRKREKRHSGRNDDKIKTENAEAKET